MNYLHYPITAEEGAVIRVELRGNAANVMLMDTLNFLGYQRGRAFRYMGGYRTRSPALLHVPAAGHWHVVVDLGGRSGNVQAAVSVH